jgi:hypothetical protein
LSAASKSPALKRGASTATGLHKLEGTLKRCIIAQPLIDTLAKGSFPLGHDERTGRVYQPLILNNLCGKVDAISSLGV